MLNSNTQLTLAIMAYTLNVIQDLQSSIYFQYKTFKMSLIWQEIISGICIMYFSQRVKIIVSSNSYSRALIIVSSNSYSRALIIVSSNSSSTLFPRPFMI